MGVPKKPQGLVWDPELLQRCQELCGAFPDMKPKEILEEVYKVLEEQAERQARPVSPPTKIRNRRDSRQGEHIGLDPKSVALSAYGHIGARFGPDEFKKLPPGELASLICWRIYWKYLERLKKRRRGTVKSDSDLQGDSSRGNAGHGADEESVSVIATSEHGGSPFAALSRHAFRHKTVADAATSIEREKRVVEGMTALSRIDSVQCQVLHWRFVEKLSRPATANKLGLTEKQVVLRETEGKNFVKAFVEGTDARPV